MSPQEAVYSRLQTESSRSKQVVTVRCAKLAIMRINRSFLKMLSSPEGQQILALVRRKQGELIAEAGGRRPPVQILADDARNILPGLAKPRPDQHETHAAKRLRYRQRQFVGAVVGAEMAEIGWNVHRHGVRIPSSNAVFFGR